MKIIPANDVIGKSIIYQDYLGMQRYGKIAWVEEYNGPDNDDPEGTVVWVYIIDEDPEYNVHEMIVNFGTDMQPNVKSFMYAEIRLSTEITLDEER